MCFLFSSIIIGFYSQNKIRILVTHQLHHLTNCKRICILDNGRIQAQGSFEQLQNTKSFKDLHTLPEPQQRTDNVPEKKRITTNSLNRVDDATPQHRNIQRNYYQSYLLAAGSSLAVCGAAAFLLLAQLATSSMDMFVAKW